MGVTGEDGRSAALPVVVVVGADAELAGVPTRMKSHGGKAVGKQARTAVKMHRVIRLLRTTITTVRVQQQPRLHVRRWWAPQTASAHTTRTCSPYSTITHPLQTA